LFISIIVLGTVSVCELEDSSVSFVNIPLIYIRHSLLHIVYKVLLNSKLVLKISLIFLPLY